MQMFGEAVKAKTVRVDAWRNGSAPGGPKPTPARRRRARC